MTIPFILKDHSTYGSDGDDMLELQAVHDRLSLNGKVRCENCNTNMTNAFGIFSCTTAACPTPDISEDVLLTAVMSKLVDRITTDETLERVSQNINEITAPDIQHQATTLDTAEYGVNYLNSWKARLTREVDLGLRSLPDLVETINEIDKQKSSLAYEATVARDELDKLQFISDTEGIRDTAEALDTYLKSHQPEYVQELLDLVVDQVRLSERAIRVIYTQNLPSQDDPGALPEDVFRLP